MMPQGLNLFCHLGLSYAMHRLQLFPLTNNNIIVTGNIHDIQNIMFEFSGGGRKREEKSCLDQERNNVTRSLQHTFIAIFIVTTI